MTSTSSTSGSPSDWEIDTIHVEHHGHDSPSTGVRMPVIEYGRAGAPLVYLPSSGGNEGEFERYGMHEAVAPWISAGRLRCYSVDTRGPEGLFNDEIPPHERIASYVAVERYLATELLPWVRERTSSPRVALVGSSYGAFVAANLLFKLYESVDVVCGLGGVYEMWHRLEGYHDDDVYFHTPLEYLPRLGDPVILAGIRATRGIDLFAGQQDEWLRETHQLEQVLRERDLPHRVDVWPRPADHHERWWRAQLPVFLERRFGLVERSV